MISITLQFSNQPTHPPNCKSIENLAAVTNTQSGLLDNHYHEDSQLGLIPHPMSLCYLSVGPF